MVALKDPEIKLFGMTISLPSLHPHLPPPPSEVTFRELQPPPPPPQDQKPSEEEELEGKEEDKSSHQRSEGLKDPTTSPSQSTSPSASPSVSVDKETSSPKTTKEGEQSESQEKTLKKPDKILPCPRCNSMDTKFCYYNNYNVNQPRHFCKNCQRYWTAGGTMRNVPVGAGRRKNKNSTATASHYRHIMVSEALHQSARASGANGIRHPTLGTNGTVLNFGSDGPLCESMASVLNLADKRHNCLQTGSENGGDDHSTITLTSSAEKGGLQEPMGNNFQPFPPHVPCFPGATWSYSWNSTMMPPPAFCPPGFPISYYPAPTYWGCTLPESWNTPTLGKHSRDGEVLNPAKTRKEDHQKENNPESGVWIPKTLRIDDPNEAAKSSIWTTLGIKNDGRSNGVVSLLKAFQSKGDEKKHTSEMSPVLQANPAALSRSLNFHERA